jgi:hypothetical protein
MIRPLTIATCLLACGSGLYLYQSKHEVQLLDRTIERTVHDTGSLREQSRLLAAEWTMLNDPERLRQFSDTYLSLKTIAPPQFTSLADLDSRLPAPRKEEAPPPNVDVQEPGSVVADAASPGVPDAAPADAVVADEDLPVPPIPATPAAVVASAPRPAENRPSDRPQGPRPMAADSQARSVAVADARFSEPRPVDQRLAERSPEQRPFEQRPPEQRPPEQRGAVRVAEARPEARPPIAAPFRQILLAAPRPLPANAPINAPPMQYRPPMVATSAPYGGSLLGMARGSMPPAPRPTPVNAAYNAN